MKGIHLKQGGPVTITITIASEEKMGPSGVLVNAWLLELRKIQASGALFRRKHVFENFSRTFGHRMAEEISTRELHSWLMRLGEERNYTVRTLRMIKSEINHLFRHLMDHEVILRNPIALIKLPKNEPPRRSRVVLSEEEIRPILQNAKDFSLPFLYPYLYALVHTGARRSELLKLKWQQVDFTSSTITFLKTKNGKDRTIKMAAGLLALLKSSQKRSEYVFTNAEGGRIGRNQIFRKLVAFKRRYPQAKHWGSHSFRHSFAYQFLKKGGQMYQLQAILGHSQIGMTVDLYGQLQAIDVENPSPFDL